MDFINYLIISLISFFGLILGIILVLIAPEEQKTGKKYFILLQDLFFILSITLFLSFFRVNIIFIFFVMLLFIIIRLKIKIRNNFKKAELMYLILAFIFFLSLRNIDLFLIESVLIFLFGMPTGSLLFSKRKRNYLKVVFKNIIFLVIASLLFLLSYLSSYHIS